MTEAAKGVMSPMDIKQKYFTNGGTGGRGKIAAVNNLEQLKKDILNERPLAS